MYFIYVLELIKLVPMKLQFNGCKQIGPFPAKTCAQSWHIIDNRNRQPCEVTNAERLFVYYVPEWNLTSRLGGLNYIIIVRNSMRGTIQHTYQHWRFNSSTELCCPKLGIFRRWKHIYLWRYENLIIILLVDKCYCVISIQLLFRASWEI